MINRIAITASALAVLAAAASAQVPFFSFSSGGIISATRTDTATPGDTTFTLGAGGYVPPAVDIIAAAGTYTNVSFSLSNPLTASGDTTTDLLEDDAFTDGGTISVFDGATLLFDVTFASATLTADTFSARDDEGDSVVYSNVIAALQPFVTNTGSNAISFSFADRTPGSNSVSYSTAASFSSQPVPEPATMAALGLGAAAMLRRRRKA